ncbi:MAG: hypothetical protein HFE77_01015 [Clostridiales bacterium]|nr:hypothetical protein [Clostridiales bacterium]
MKNCAHCGCVNDSVNRYCRNCGMRFPEEEAPSGNTAAEVSKIQPFFDVPESDFWDQGLASGGLDPVEKPVEDLPLQTTPAVPSCPPPARPVIDFDFMDKQEAQDEESLPLAPFPFGGRENDINAVIHTLRKNGASLCMLCFCLFFTISLILSIWSYVGSLGLYEVSLWFTGHEQGTLTSEQNLVFGLLMAVQILRIMPGLLTIIGMWLFYRACLSRKRSYVKTSGLGVVYSGAVLQICLLSLGLLACVAGGAIIIWWGGHPIAVSRGAIGVLILVAVLLIGVIVLRIIYSAKLMGMIRRVRHMAATGEADANISVFVIVMTLLEAIASAPFIGYCIAAGDFIEMGSIIARMLALIFISVGLLHYREGVKNIVYRIKHPLPTGM